MGLGVEHGGPQGGGTTGQPRVAVEEVPGEGSGGWRRVEAEAGNVLLGVKGGA